NEAPGETKKLLSDKHGGPDGDVRNVRATRLAQERIIGEYEIALLITFYRVDAVCERQPEERARTECAWIGVEKAVHRGERRCEVLCLAHKGGVRRFGNRDCHLLGNRRE